LAVSALAISVARELILLSVPWTAVPEALKAAGYFEAKILFSCVNTLTGQSLIVSHGLFIE
jgi:predicted dinucleotide-binding enzyme